MRCPAPHVLVCAWPAISFHEVFILQLFDILKNQLIDYQTLTYFKKPVLSRSERL